MSAGETWSLAGGGSAGDEGAIHDGEVSWTRVCSIMLPILGHQALVQNASTETDAIRRFCTIVVMTVRSTVKHINWLRATSIIELRCNSRSLTNSNSSTFFLGQYAEQREADGTSFRWQATKEKFRVRAGIISRVSKSMVKLNSGTRTISVRLSQTSSKDRTTDW